MKALFEELAKPYLVRIIEDNPETIKEKTGEIWNKRKDEIIMDGFRKGKVPQDLVEKKEGFQNLYREYIESLVKTCIEKAGKENNVIIGDIDQIIPEQINKEMISLQAVVYLKPEVRELDYSNVEVKKPTTEITEQDLDAQIDHLRQQQALLVPVTDRGVMIGDTIVLSFEGSLQDSNGQWVPFKGGSVTRQRTDLTEGAFIAGFGEAIVGMNQNETKTFQVTFPTDYHAAHLAGKLAQFDLTAHEVFVKNLPSDEDLAATHKQENLEQLRNVIKMSIEKTKNDQDRSQIEHAICMKLLDRANISPIPAIMVQKRLQTMLQQQLSSTGLTRTQYFQKNNMNEQLFERSYYNTAKRDLMIQLILDHIAATENFVVTDESRDQYVSDEAIRLGYTVEQLKRIVSQEQTDSQLKMKLAYDYLLANATYTE